jgi:hypothetical protein
MNNLLNPNANQLQNAHLDITEPGMDVEIRVSDKGVVWVNAGPICVLRICRTMGVTLQDDRVQKMLVMSDPFETEFKDELSYEFEVDDAKLVRILERRAQAAVEAKDGSSLAYHLREAAKGIDSIYLDTEPPDVPASGSVEPCPNHEIIYGETGEREPLKFTEPLTPTDVPASGSVSDLKSQVEPKDFNVLSKASYLGKLAALYRVANASDSPECREPWTHPDMAGRACCSLLDDMTRRMAEIGVITWEERQTFYDTL